MGSTAPGTHFDDFAIAHLFPIDRKTDECPDGMPPLSAGSARVHVETVQFFVIDDFQNMGMAADEELRCVCVQLFFDGGVVAWGIAADMGHEDLYTFRLPVQFFRVDAPDIRPIYITVYSSQRFEAGEALGEGDGAEIPRVPDLVAGIEMPEDGFVQEMVSVGEQADLEHRRAIFL